MEKDIIYRTYYARLFKFVYEKIRNRVTAQDIVHDVFLQFFQLKRPEEVADIESYLFIATRNRCLKYFKGTGNTVELEESHNLITDMKEVLKARLHTIALHAIDTLSPKNREVIRLRTEGKTYQQIAVLMGTTLDIAKKQGVEAIKELREKCSKYDIDRNESGFLIFTLLCSIAWLLILFFKK